MTDVIGVETRRVLLRTRLIYALVQGACELAALVLAWVWFGWHGALVVFLTMVAYLCHGTSMTLKAVEASVDASAAMMGG